MIQRLVLAAAVAGLAATGAAAQPAYQLQPGDRLAISVLEDPGLNREVLVGPDGRISLPLAGVVEVEGRSVEEIQGLIRSRLANDFIEPPTVTASLVGVSQDAGEDLGLASIYILGQVGGPGVYEIEPPVDVLQALAIAGGPGPFAARDRIQIRRRVGGAETVFLFDYDQVEDGAAPISSVQLEDGDVIVVPERGLFD